MSISNLIDLQPPSDIGAERALVGSIFIRPECLDKLGTLQPEDFHDDACRLMFRVCGELREAGKPIDARLVVAELKRRGTVGAAEIAQAVNTTPNAANAKHYADIVRRKATFRNLIEAGTRMLSEAYTESRNPEDIAASLNARLDSVHGDDSDLIPIASCVEALRQARSEPNRFGVSTGILPLDELTGGLKPSQLTVLAAATSIGKTALAAQVARAAAERGKSVLIVTLEVDGRELLETKLVKHHGGDFEQSLSEIAKLPITVYERGSLDVSRIAGLVKLLKARSGCELVVVDYLQLLSGQGKTRYEQVSHISRALKALSADCKVPVLALSQLSRDHAKTGRKPQLHDLRESGTIEQDANNVWILHRENKLATDAELIVAKHRGGPIATIELQFDAQRQWFSERATYEQQEFESDFGQYSGAGF